MILCGEKNWCIMMNNETPRQNEINDDKLFWGELSGNSGAVVSLHDSCIAITITITITVTITITITKIVYKKRVYRQYPGLPYERQSLIEKAHLWQPKSGSTGQHSNSVNLVLTQTEREGRTNNHSCHPCVGSRVRGWRSESFTRFFSSSWLALPPVVMYKVRWLKFRRRFNQ